DGEMLVRSEMIFSGYYKETEKTAEVMRDGWLLTGDLGRQDADGFLRITGRKKELIVLSTGKKVAPSLIENMIKEHHLVSHAYVHGEGRSYLVALVTLNPVEAEEHARARRQLRKLQRPRENRGDALARIRDNRKGEPPRLFERVDQEVRRVGERLPP